MSPIETLRGFNGARSAIGLAQVVRELSSGEGPLRLFVLEESGKDLVVMDAMDDAAGKEVLNQIRECADRIPVLWASGYHPPEEAEASVGMRFLQEPCSGDVLAAAVAQALAPGADIPG